MRAVVTRVSSASVSIDGATVGAIGTGFLVLLGIGPNDTQAQAEKLADKICGLRVFARRGREDEFEPGRRGRGPAGGLPVHPVRRYQEPPARVHQGRAPGGGHSPV